MIALQVIVVVVCLVFMLLVFKQVSKGRLLLKYSFLWLTLALLIILVAVFPSPVFELAHLLNFDVPSNFIFFGALLFLAAISLSLSVVVSRQALRMKDMVQNMALLEKRLNENVSHNHDISQTVEEDNR